MTVEHHLIYLERYPLARILTKNLIKLALGIYTLISGLGLLYKFLKPTKGIRQLYLVWAFTLRFKNGWVCHHNE